MRIVFITPLSETTRNFYLNSNVHKFEQRYNQQADSGIDLFVPSDTTLEANTTNLVDLDVIIDYVEISNRPYTKCFQTDGKIANLYRIKRVPYQLYARSSLSKTPLRLANSVGIIDAQYTNSLKLALDNYLNYNGSPCSDYKVKAGDRLSQIVNYQGTPPDMVCLSTNIQSKLLQEIYDHVKYAREENTELFHISLLSGNLIRDIYRTKSNQTNNNSTTNYRGKGGFGSTNNVQ